MRLLRGAHIVRKSIEPRNGAGPRRPIDRTEPLERHDRPYLTDEGAIGEARRDALDVGRR